MDELCRREARRAMIEKLKNPKCRKRDLTPLSSTAHSGDFVLPFSSFFLEFFSPELRDSLVARSDQAGVSLLKPFSGLGPVHNVIVRFNNIQKTG